MRYAVLLALWDPHQPDLAAWSDAVAALSATLTRLGFTAAVIDGRDNVLEQTARALGRLTPEDTLLLHVSGHLARRGVLRLPGGDWLPLRSVGDALAERGISRVAVVTELLHDDDASDTQVAREHVDTVVAALQAHERGYGVVVTARPASTPVAGLPFTGLLFRVAAQVRPEDALLSSVFGRAAAMPERLAAAQAIAFERGAFDLSLAAQPLTEELDGLVAAATDARDWARVVDLRRMRLQAHDTPRARVRELVSIARILQAELDEPQQAIAALEEARAIDPARVPVLQALRRGYERLGRWASAIETVGALAALADTASDRAELQFARARLVLEHLGDEERAVELFEQTLADDPTHERARVALTDLVSSRVQVLERPSEAELLEDVEEVEAAPVAEETTDVERDETTHVAGATAAAPHDEAPPTQRADAAYPDEVTRIHRPESQDPEEATYVHRYDSQLEVTPVPYRDEATHVEGADVVSTHDLEEDAAELSRTASQAPVSRSSLPTQPPGDPLFERLVADMRPVDVPDEVAAAGDGAVEEATPAIDASAPPPPLPAIAPSEPPGPPSADTDALRYAEAFAAHRREGRTDRAFLAALALEELGAAEVDHQVLIDQFRSVAPIRARGTFAPTVWALLQPLGIDVSIDAVFRAVGPAAVAARRDELAAADQLVELNPSTRVDEQSTALVARTFHWAARVLGVSCPGLFVVDKVPGEIAAVRARNPSTALGPSVVQGRSPKELAFLAGRHLTYARPEFELVIYYPTREDLIRLLFAALQVVRPQTTPPAGARAVASLRNALARKLTPRDRAALAEAVRLLESRGGKASVGSWTRAVELTATRVGLFLCGDLATAMTLLRAEFRTTAVFWLEEKRRDLVQFCASDVHAELRSRYAVTAPESVRPPAFLPGNVRQDASAAAVPE